MALKYSEEWYKEEKEAFAISLSRRKKYLTHDTIDFLVAAYTANDWDWRTSNGCNVVSEKWWPNQYFPPCVAHDYQCVLANRAPTRREADRIRKYGDVHFLKSNKAYSVGFFSRWIRYWGVRRFWMLSGRWKVKK